MARSSDLQKTIKPVMPKSEKPKPLACLTATEARRWNDIFNCIDDDWISKEQYDLLANYCRHLDSADEMSVLIENHRQDLLTMTADQYIKSLDRLSKMRDREVRAATSLATKLRLTNQSLRSSHDVKPLATKKPWE
ncbi:hypothetical protein [Cereibacter changlensis]|uniref:hypothetical protein n=1 Tax=Cereibacter changlensis TaxID=402884 RepID=UPI00403362A1